jgi:hypothetical protein
MVRPLRQAMDLTLAKQRELGTSIERSSHKPTASTDFTLGDDPQTIVELVPGFVVTLKVSDAMPIHLLI